MKGQLSEAELHFLRSRLRGGILAKARRGELRLQLPIGLAYDPRGQVTLDPDTGIRGALSHLFTTFASTGSAFAVVKTFRQTQLTFPGRHRSGPRAGELYWKNLSHDQVLKILHNPAYAGAYSYGRSRHTTDLDGHHHTLSKLADDWTVLIIEHHPGYITWPQYQANQQVLAANAAARGENRKAGPPREGPALLQGLIICGICGRRMTVRYHSRNDGTIVPDYVCQNDGIRDAQPICQHLSGAPIDAAVASLLLDTLTPLALEAALTVSDELIRNAEHADSLRAAHVQRAHTPPTRPAAATWPSTPATGSSPTPSKPTGTPRCASWPPPTTTTPPPRPRPSRSMPPSAPASTPWRPTSPPSGTTRPPRRANASASSASWSPTSPSPAASTPSPPPSASPAASTTSCTCPSRATPGNCAKPPTTSLS